MSKRNRILKRRRYMVRKYPGIWQLIEGCGPLTEPASPELQEWMGAVYRKQIEVEKLVNRPNDDLYTKLCLGEWK